MLSSTRRKKVADKGEESSATGNSKKSSGGLQQRKGKTTTVISKFLIPVTTYIRKTRVSGIVGVPWLLPCRRVWYCNEYDCCP